MATLTIPQALELALQNHRQGRLADAEGLYRSILAVDPGHAQTLHLLGLIAQQSGNLEAAAELFRHALAREPAFPAAYLDLGNVLQSLCRWEESFTVIQEGLRYAPSDPSLLNNLAVSLKELNRPLESEAASREAVRLQPSFHQAWSNLGNALVLQKRLPEAIEAYRQCLALKPDYHQAHFNLAGVLRQTGDFLAATASYVNAVRCQPDLMVAWEALADTAYSAGQYPIAIEAAEMMARQRPTEIHWLNLRGNALRFNGQPLQSLPVYKAALQLDPKFAYASSNMGNAYRELGRLDEAIAAYRRAIETDPAFGAAYNNLGCVLKDQNFLDECLVATRRASELDPERSQILSNLIYTMHFHPESDADAIEAEHRLWNQRYVHPHYPIAPHLNARDPERRLKVGYVSPNLWQQSESYFILPLFEGHHRESVQLYAYAKVHRPDAVTARLRQCVEVWRDVHHLSDDDFAAQIRADGIDVLMDLTMHMAESQLTVFARRPAPVQVSWLAYPGTTGLETISGWITDTYMEPPGASAPTAGGRPVHLPNSWCAFDPITELPPEGPLPALSSGCVTFSSMNNVCKNNPATLLRFARVLQAVPGSRLLMLSPEGNPRRLIFDFFATHGIGPERLEIFSHIPRADYLRTYQRVDLGLDPNPYNGITTTCDAFLMGVPVLTLPETRPASRAGLSLLSTVGLPEFAATSEDDYVRLAVEWSRNLPRLAEIRATLRARMRASPLMDASLFAHQMEDAYRTLWKEWCASPAS